MKAALSFIALLCLIYGAHAENMVKLRGKITHPLSDSIAVQFYTDIMTYTPEKYGSKVKSDGTFQLSFPVPNGFTKMNIIHGDQQTDLIAEPGYDLSITLNAQNFDSTLHYSGKGSDVANFCALNMVRNNGLLGMGIAAQPLYNEQPDNYEKSMDSLLRAQQAFNKANTEGLSEGFIKYLNSHYLYSYYGDILLYPVFHEIYKQHSYTVTNIPKENYAVIAKVPVAFDDNLLSQSSYLIYLDRVFNARLDAAGISDTGKVHNEKKDSLMALTYNAMPPATSEYCAAQHLYRNAKYNSNEDNEKELKRFRAHFPKSKYLPVINKSIAFLQQTNTGAPAIDFTIKTIDGKTLKLSELRGKVVLIDFWASWCGPCISEMPHAAEVEKYYEGKDVVFLYVSIDENEDSWKKAIEKYKIKGMHMRDDGSFQGKVAKLYEVEGVPGYFLIDKNGNFGERNVPRPSEDVKLKAAIDKLLQ